MLEDNTTLVKRDSQKCRLVFERSLAQYELVGCEGVGFQEQIIVCCQSPFAGVRLGGAAEAIRVSANRCVISGDVRAARTRELA